MLNPSELQQSFVTNLALAENDQLPMGQLFTLADTFNSSGSSELAINLYKSWVTHTSDPNKVLAMFNHASLLQSTGKTQEAEILYRECLQLRPYFAQPCINLGLILERRGERQQALVIWRDFLSQHVGNENVTDELQVTAWNHIGRVHEDLKQYQLAEEALVQSLSINPNQTGVIQHWVHIRQKSCDWPIYKPLHGISRHQMLMATSPLAMLALTEDPVQQLLTAHAFVGRTYSFKQEYLSKGRTYDHQRLRIGYVSGDLCVHAVGLLLAELLEGHDRTKFEIYAYDFSIEDGTPHRQRLKSAIDHIRFVHTLNERQIAEVVLHDEIDVLIDLHGLSAGARPGIFALHPAPLQGTYLGFIGTTGMPWFDFVITDDKAFPEELEPYFAEKPLRLKSSFIPLTPDADAPLTIKREQLGLPIDAFVMAVFANSYKITPEMFQLWLSLLKELPNAVLWMIDDNPATTRNLKQCIQANQADANRIIFTPRASYEEYKQRLKLADVFLDTFPYNCGSTTNNVVQAGLPMVSMYGKTMVSRMGLSILSSMGLAHYCVDNPADYKNRVHDIFKLNEEKKIELREKMLSIRGKQNLAKEIEVLIEEAYKKFRTNAVVEKNE